MDKNNPVNELLVASDNVPEEDAVDQHLPGGGEPIGDQELVTTINHLPANFAVAGTDRPPDYWVLLSPSSVKLLCTLCFIGRHGTVTSRELSELSGLSERTVESAKFELSSNALVKLRPQPGRGTEWELRPAQQHLVPAGEQYFDQRLKREGKSLANRKNKLKEARQLLDDVRSGKATTRFKQVAANAVRVLAEESTTVVDPK